jgi:hypothetical protein
MAEQMTLLETQQIEAAKILAGLPGMDESPLVLELHDRWYNRQSKFGEQYSCSIMERKYAEPADGSIDFLGNSTIGPYLQIEDGNPWSSSAILVRAGKSPMLTLPQWILHKYLESEIDDPNWEEFMTMLLLALKEGRDELANVLGINKLHEIAPDVYAKGMEILLEGK